MQTGKKFLLFSYNWQIHVTGTSHSPYKLDAGDFAVPTQDTIYCYVCEEKYKDTPGENVHE
jgi:hypothetical protein